MPPYLLAAPYDHHARRARLVAAVGVMIGTMLIWGSLAALNRWVLGFSAWPERGAVAIGRVVMADAPARGLSPAVGLPPVAAGREISLLDGSGLGAAGSVSTDVAGGDRRAASPQGVRGVPDGRPVGVLAPGSEENPNPSLIVPVPSRPGSTQTVTPVNLDTDNDGLPDAWEVSNGLNPNSPADAAADSDGDGIVNSVEFTLKSDPQTADAGRDIRRDSDGDGVSDEDEIARGTDPAVADPPAAEPAPGGEGEPAPVPAADDAPETEPPPGGEPATEPAGEGEPATVPGADEEPATEPVPEDAPPDGDGTPAPAPDPGSETEPVAEPAPTPVEGAPDCEPAQAGAATEAPDDVADDESESSPPAEEQPAAPAPAGS